ncbi:hypothetical protein ACFXGT_33050 [Streptomyces sp. NPDC059352]|uniref:hypothetical protein n=1 Tax=Streptomyces sp. NPDC059352 TaxID=3346810 RepID=UPI0036B4D28D
MGERERRRRGQEDRTAPRGQEDRTAPSHAAGGGGDQEAEEPVPVRPGDADPESAHGHSAKRQRPGIGREEQTRTYRGQEGPPVET